MAIVVELYKKPIKKIIIIIILVPRHTAIYELIANMCIFLINLNEFNAVKKKL